MVYNKSHTKVTGILWNWCNKFLIMHIPVNKLQSFQQKCSLTGSSKFDLKVSENTLLTILVVKKKKQTKSSVLFCKEYLFERFSLGSTEGKCWGTDSCLYPCQRQPIKTWTKYMRIWVHSCPGRLPELTDSISSSANGPDLISSWPELCAHTLCTHAACQHHCAAHAAVRDL